MVVEESTGRAWLYSARQHDLRAVVVQSSQRSTGTQIWPPFDPSADPEGLSLVVYWFKEKQALALAVWDLYVIDFVHGAMLLDLSTARGVELDFGSKPWTHWQRAAVWNPTGDSIQITLKGESVLPELLVNGLYKFRLLIVERGGEVDRELIAAASCRNHDAYESVPRHRADWSPNGNLFAVGGHEPPGLLPVLEGSNGGCVRQATERATTRVAPTVAFWSVSRLAAAEEGLAEHAVDGDSEWATAWPGRSR